MWNTIGNMIKTLEAAGYESRLLFDGQGELDGIAVIDLRNNVVFVIFDGDYMYMNREIDKPRNTPWMCDYFLATIERCYSKSAPVDVTHEVSRDQLDMTLFSYLAEWYKEKYPQAEDAWLLLQEYANACHYIVTTYNDYIKACEGHSAGIK